MFPLPPINEQRILAVYAHPDDECYCTGGTFAKYSAAGAETMVISATKGQAGQINDANVATRQTLGVMREKEFFLSCQRLGVRHVQCWDYMDGALSQADWKHLVGDLVQAIRQFRPHIVITFGPDGAYGHPDHVAICHATTQAFHTAHNASAYPEQAAEVWQPSRLYYAYFPERRQLLLDHLVKWLVSRRERFHGSLDFVHGLALFAEESTLLHYSNDFIDVRWFPPGFCIIEQGESAASLYIILSGHAEVKREEADGTLTHLAVLETGHFFGETAIAGNHARNAHVIAKDTVTCMVFSPGEPTHFAGRGEGAVFGEAALDHAHMEDSGLATHVIDVEAYVQAKISAISAHRTQYPITPDMFPEEMLQDLFGREYFVRVYPPTELETML